MRIHRLYLTLVAAALLALVALAAFPGPQDAGETPSVDTVPAGGSSGETAAYGDLRAQAEAFYAEGSYARAYELYRGAAAPDEDEERWIAFRLADTRWRSTGDRAAQEEARRKLEEMVLPGDQDPKVRDRVWIEAHESLGDYHWRSGRRDWGSAWPHYQAALDAWAGSSDVELARARYLDVVWRVADKQEGEAYGYYGRYSIFPLDVLENTLKIARDSGERARAHYLIAMTLKLQGQWRSRLVREFEAALEEGPDTDWYDDALFHYADFLANWNRLKEGVYVHEYNRAAELFRRFLRELSKGETPYYDPARQRLDQITGPQLGVYLSQVFLPGSEIEYALTWRNLKTIELNLYAADLGRDVRLDGGSSWQGWQQRVDVAGRTPLRAWTFDTGDSGDHEPGQETRRLAEKLEPGAYVLVARSGERSAQELVLVTDAAVVLRSSPARTLAYVCNALDGSPIAGADVVVRERLYEGNEYVWRERTLRSGEDGLASFAAAGNEIFVTANAGGRQAVAGTYRGSGSSRGGWRVYAFTDRPAYRPGETAYLKVLARRDDGGKYTTPEGAVVSYQITDPRGTKVAEAELQLNAFGSAWAELPLTPEMTLGLYQVSFSEKGRAIGTANLLRLEEYKLPEMRVRVETPEEDGKKKSFRLGETVEVEVTAEYYFGGPAAGADVELRIYQKPFYPWWRPPRPFPWFYPAQGRYGYGPGQLLDTRQGKTDAEGRARFTFDTSPDLGSDFDYHLEARVVDSSRREVTGAGTVRVTRQRYFVYPRREHCLYRPGDRVTVQWKALDPNDEPVAAQGTVRVTRDRWSGQEYEHEEVLQTTVRTNAEGEAELQFDAPREGYYQVAWTSEEDDDFPVRAWEYVWVATRESRDFGYHHDGVEILVDRDTFRAGETAPVMLATAASGRWVLLTVEAEGILDYRLVHVEGTVKLLTFEVDESYVPNVYLSATLVEDTHVATDQKEVIVPPVEHFLEVEVETDREAYEPREKGVLTVTTRDHDGRPVAAEVALSVADEAVYAIQDDLAGDPRQFFFGDKRSPWVWTASSFDERPYVRVEPPEPLPAGAVPPPAPPPPAPMVADMAFSIPEAEGLVAEEAVLGRDEGARRAQVRAAPKLKKEGAEGAGEEDAVQVRTDFRATVLWRPDVVTGEDGRASVEMTFPDSLTSWKATARAAGRGSRFGIAESSARTRMPLMVRLQAPRFFVVGDRVTVSAVLNNTTGEAFRVSPELEAEGLRLVSQAGPVTVPAGGEARADWIVVAEEPGTARLTASGRGGRYSDAMRKDYPVYEHGVEKRVTIAGKVRGGETTVTLELPPKRRATSFEVRLAPSLATTMLDALPYLADYPYGCTEQTMSRFLPAVLVAKTLSDLGVSPEAVAGRLFGGIEEESAGKTHPHGKRDLAQLDDMTAKGLARLYDFQHGDGGWGWWKEGDSDHFMTAYVVWGLVLAREAGIAVDARVLARGVDFLDKEIVEAERQGDLQAWMLHALARHQALSKSRTTAPPVSQAFKNLWEHRDGLAAYSRALLAIAAHDLGEKKKASVLLRNLENGAVHVSASTHEGGMSTVHWGDDGFYWRWYRGPVESTAFVLQALVTLDPKNEMVEPAMNWLVKNRRGAQWSNTRDTAISLMALLDYLKQSGELASDQEAEVFVNGRSVGTRRFSASDVLAAPAAFPVEERHLRDGANEIRVVRRGKGALYFAAQAEYVDLEEPVTPAGYEIFVRRSYQKLVGRPTLLKGIVYDKRPLEDGGSVRSGERVAVTLTVEAKNDYEYLIFEDLKPAGFEAAEVKSGGPLWAREIGSDGKETGRRRWVYRELRDRKVALFVDKLPQGTWQIDYELRAEVPGEFHALPVLAQAMYVPEIRANGQEVRVTVEDRE